MKFNNLEDSKKEKVNELKDTDFGKQMIGSTPGLEFEDVNFMRKSFLEKLSNFNNENPAEAVADLFNIEDNLRWIDEAIQLEKEKSKDDQEKNKKLLDFLAETVKDIYDAFIDLVNKNPGYLIRIVVDKYIAKIFGMSSFLGLRLQPTEALFKDGHSILLSQIIAFVPSVEDIRFMRKEFYDKGDLFRIKYGSVDKQDSQKGWTPIEELKEYTEINKNLVNSKNIINLSSYDTFLKYQKDLPVFDMSFKDKLFLYNFLLRVNEYNLDRVSMINQKMEDKVSFLRTFLSIEHGGKEMGNKILTLGEKLPKEVAEKVFIKYGEIIDSTEDINQILRERFGKEEENQEIILKIKENLLKKGKDLLLDSAKNLDKCTDTECIELGKNIEEKLDFISKENILLGSTFKELLKKENLQINEIQDVSLEMINTPEGIIKYKAELIRIFKENREGYPEELLKETLTEFEEALNNIEDKEFYILKNKEDILAFMRFDILENGNYYAGSLNGRNEIQGLAVAGSFLKQLLIDKSKERNIEAVVYENNQMLNRYANEFGFKIVGEIENYKNTGQKFYKLEIQKDSLE